MLIGQSNRVFSLCMWGKEAQAYLSFFSVRRGKSIAKAEKDNEKKPRGMSEVAHGRVCLEE